MKFGYFIGLNTTYFIEIPFKTLVIRKIYNNEITILVMSSYFKEWSATIPGGGGGGGW